jgi:Xaa-Pro aminopeptidase
MKRVFHENNRKKLMEKVEDNSAVVVFSGRAPYKSGDELFSFTPSMNFYYLTGIEREKFVLLMTKINGEIDEQLFIEKSNPLLARWIGERMKPEEAQQSSGIEKIDYIENFQSAFGTMVNKNEMEKVYLDLERQEWEMSASEDTTFAYELSRRYPYVEIKDLHRKISELRVIKSKEEIEKLREAISITREAIYNVWKNAKPEMMEYELEAYFNFTLKNHGITDFAFKTIMASGKNAAVLHYSKNNSKTSANDLVLMDLGAQSEHYNADISRTFPISGRFSQRQRKIYEVVLSAQKAVQSTAKPGVPFKRLNEVACEVLANGCRTLGLIKNDSELSEYYFHGVSHFIGLDTHDVGNRNTELKAGMVISNEPGLYIPAENIGIRIEDDLLITEDGCENLAKDIIKEPDQIEAFMKRS